MQLSAGSRPGAICWHAQAAWPGPARSSIATALAASSKLSLLSQCCLFSQAQTQLSSMLAAHATHNCKGWNEVVISKAKWERSLPQLLEVRG